MPSTIYFSFDTYSENLGGHRDDDEWSRDSHSTSWSAPRKGYLNKSSCFFHTESETVDADLKPGDTVYLTYVVWSSGDSFGHDPGAHCEVIGLYKTADLAYKAKSLIEDDAEKPYDYKDSKCHIPTFDGSTARPQYTASWKGYFESLDYVSVQELTIE